MTVLMFLAFFSFTGDSTWRTADSGVFQPLASNEVIVRPDGEIYILNFKEAYINHYDANGKMKGTIGKKGRGPGEFTYPNRICFAEGKLYVFDIMTGAISSFTKDGEFIKQHPVGRELQDMIRVKDGWILALSARQQPLEIYWADEEFENKQRLLRLSMMNTSGGVSVEMGPEGAQGVFTPISSNAIVQANTSGSHIYVCEPGGFKVHVIDSAAKKVVAEIKRDEKRIPFDTEWADERWQEMSKRLPRQDRQINFKMNYPEFFPVVRDFKVDHQGRLVFSKWMGRPDDGHNNIMALNHKGEELGITLSWGSVDRVAGVHGKWAYVTMWDEEEEEASVARCPVEALDEFIKANPVNFEGQAGRSIQIEG